MYKGELNFYTRRIIESCDYLDKHCERPCPLKTLCYQYIEDKEKEKVKPIWQDFTDKQIEDAGLALFEDILNYNWFAEVKERHTDFWTNEQRDAFREMSPFEQENISIEYEEKVINFLKIQYENLKDNILKEKEI